MSYNIAYTSQFGDPEGLLWNVEIYRDGFTGTPAEIGLDGEQPVIIEWQETKLQDAVCPSQCTLKVVNGSDRQMVPLAIDDYAYIKVYRDGKLYWTGVLDQGVYEEPYSYNDGYITEITFSDFGALNRFDFHPFSQSGRSDYIVSLKDIVDVARSLIVLDGVGMAQNVSMQLPGSGGNTAHLHHLYVNSRRFEGMTYRDVLDETLRPFGYRIIQKNGGVWVYDAEWMFGNATVKPTVWMGDDAKLSFGNVYGKLALTFNRDSRPVIADGTIDPDDKGFAESSRFYAVYKDNIITWGSAFFIDGINPSFSGKKPVTITGNCKVVRLRGKYIEKHEACMARLIWCFDTNNQGLSSIIGPPYTLLDPPPSDNLFEIESDYLPMADCGSSYNLSVSLDMLISPLLRLEDNHESIDDEAWELWTELRKVLVPIKLELIDDNGNAIYHANNTIVGSGNYIYPLDFTATTWEEGPGQWENMILSYYGEPDTCPFGSQWVKNKQTYDLFREYVPEIVKNKDKGECIPMPPVPGRIRLSVSSKYILKHGVKAIFGPC